jgi:GT2 family glycosyltransferase
VNGWLQPLVETLVDREDAGAVGGMLLYPSGAVQEAGGVIFSDGSAANVGNGESPDDPIYRFVRAVDYCSGALLATERRTFDEIGGFDDAYRPCYYEDVDYAFRLRHAGLNTYYQPRSVVVHAEGGTAGTDTSQGAKRFQVTSRETFSRRWTKDLAERAVPPAEFDRSTWVRLARRPPVNSIP